MKSQQAAEREEQQRIKTLVLNYDLHDDDQHDGTETIFLAPIVQPKLDSRKKFAKCITTTGYDHVPQTLSRAERTGRAPRARRLNLSDVDWYGRRSPQSPRSPVVPGQENMPDVRAAQKKPG